MWPIVRRKMQGDRLGMLMDTPGRGEKHGIARYLFKISVPVEGAYDLFLLPNMTGGYLYREGKFQASLTLMSIEIEPGYDGTLDPFLTETEKDINKRWLTVMAEAYREPGWEIPR